MAEDFVNVLEPQVAHVATAANLAEALDLLDKRYFNVALVDLSLQPGDAKDEQGMAFLRQLHERASAETVRSIILSAYGTNKKIRDAFRDFRVVDFLEKGDFSAPALVCAVKQALAENGLDRDLSIEFVNGNKLDDLWARFNWALREDPFQLKPELYDLFRRMFRGAESLSSAICPRGKVGRGVLRLNRIMLPVRERR